MSCGSSDTRRGADRVRLHERQCEHRSRTPSRVRPARLAGERKSTGSLCPIELHDKRQPRPLAGRIATRAPECRARLGTQDTGRSPRRSDVGEAVGCQGF